MRTAFKALIEPMFEVEAPTRSSGGDASKDLLLLDVQPLSHHSGGHKGPGGFADASANRIEGSSRAETIQGTELRDVIKGGAGGDTINGHDGNDTIFGEKGSDTINGGNGNDFISGGPGDDYLYAGDDGWLNILNGGTGRDEMWGATFENVIDIFQFTLASDAAHSHNPDAVDHIHDFRDGEDLIHLAFDANEFMPGDQGFIFVDEDDAGTAGTVWIDKLSATNAGGTGHLDMMIHGHTDNDGVADFTIRISALVDMDDIDIYAADAVYEVISADDFIFG